MLELRHISFMRGQKSVLDDISLSLQPGELVGILGANGVGKSTLLQVMAGLLPPSAGEVVLGGAPLHSLAVLPRHIAFLDAGGVIEWDMAAEAVVALGRKARGASGMAAEDTRAVEHALGEVDGLYLRHRAAASLSTGEKARVLLARVLAQETPVLLLDEPVASLDPAHQLAVMEVLHTRARGGVAVAAVLHDITLAARFCDRLLLLHQGRLLAEGGALEVLSDSKAEAALGVSVAQFEVEGTRYIFPHKIVRQTDKVDS